MSDQRPPRKDVTAWEWERGDDDDPPFVVLTLHHGLRVAGVKQQPRQLRR